MPSARGTTMQHARLNRAREGARRGCSLRAQRNERQSASARQEPAEGAHGFDERRTHNVGHLGMALGQVGANAQAARGFRWPSRGAAATASGRARLR